MNKKPSLKKELAFRMKKEVKEKEEEPLNVVVKREVKEEEEEEAPPLKFVKQEEVKEEEVEVKQEHGRKREYEIFKADPVKLEREARARTKTKKMRMDEPVEEAHAQLPIYPIADPSVRYLEYNKPKRIGFFPTVARNYTFWADLIFKPGSRSVAWSSLWKAQAGGAKSIHLKARML